MAGKMTDKEAPRNEIYYLNDVFEKMKFEESQIHDILEKRNSDAQRLHLREMLTGTLESSEKTWRSCSLMSISWCFWQAWMGGAICCANIILTSVCIISCK